MLTVSNRLSPMGSAITITDATRSALGLLVDREERRVGSRDVAFENVAHLVGTSASWVKKFVGKSPEVKEPRITLFLNIRLAYENMCNRVEQENLVELANIATLKGAIDAAVAGFVEQVSAGASAAAAGEKTK